uniref:Uncharacterized protein n=1 Tax=Anguilla anguilla TaxID=7936 RepID=A0A0E9X9F5_ANGAN
MLPQVHKLTVFHQCGCTVCTRHNLGGGYPTPTLCPSIQTAGQFQLNNQTLKILISDMFWRTHVKTRTMQLIFNNKSTVHYIKTQFHNSQFILPFKNSNGFFFCVPTSQH